MMRARRLNVCVAILLISIMVLPSVFALTVRDATAEPDVRRIILLDDRTDAAGLVDAGIEVLEDYGSFVLVRAEESRLEAMGLNVMVTQYGLDTLEIAGHTFDPVAEGEPDLAAGLAVGPDGYGQYGHHIVQFYGPIRAQWKETARQKGAFIDDYLPNNAFIMGMDRATLERVEDVPQVRSVVPYQPAYKVQRGLLDMEGAVDLQAIIFDDVVLSDTLIHVSELAEITFVDTTTHIKIGLRMEASDIPALARIDGVKWIERAPVWVSHSSTATWIMQSGVTGSTPITDAGLDGEGQAIFNTDTGIEVDHDAYHDPGRSVQFSNPGSGNQPDTQHRKILNYWTFANDHDSSGARFHGTHTNGVSAGDSSPNGGTFKGIAWEANISFGDVFYDNGGNAIPSNLNNLFQKGYNDGATVSSNSWGMPWSAGAYDSQAQEADEFMWDNKDFQIMYSAGNDGSSAGSVSTPATGKNVMAIGAAEKTANGDMKGYSSRGPTDDGRLKPTLYAPTDEIGPCGGFSCSSNTYNSAGGTSNSCPAAAGAMLLLRQYYADGYYPTGTETPADAFEPTSALIRATAINGAEETNGANAHDHHYNNMPFPNNDQGWGYMNLDNALFLQGDQRKLFVEDHTDGMSTGDSEEYYVNVADQSVPLEITLAWTDYPGATGANTELVNNLDLTVQGPDGTTYKGNVYRTSGSPHESTSGGSADGKNVEESFLLVNPPTGAYSITVTATNVAQGTQPYALVVTGDIMRDPDLAILEQELQREPLGVPMEGETVTFNGTVHNYGGLVTGMVPVDFMVDGEKVDSNDFDFNMVDMRNFSFTWEAEAGLHSFEIVADPLNIIDEGEEDNNAVSTTIWVNAMPEAHFGFTPAEPYTNEVVRFDATNSSDDGVITWYRFDFGDGLKTNWMKVPTTTHVYDDDGTYNISVWVKDNMSVVSEPAVSQVRVLNRDPVVNATASTYEAYTLFDISLDGSKSLDEDGTISHEWDLGDGTTSDRPMLMHNWSDDGVYNVTLTVTDDDGATNTTTFMMNILNQVPTVYFEASVYDGNVTTPFEFNATAWDKDGDIAEWRWDFGDGNTSLEEDPVYHYKDDGNYIVTLYVVDDDGAESEVMNTTISIENLPPTANMTANSTEVRTLEDIAFTDLSEDIDGEIVNYTWNMGDGEFYNIAEPVHHYKDNGVYNIRLTVQDDDGRTATREISVKVLNRAPIPRATYNRTATEGDLLTFSANQSEDLDGAVRGYEWIFNETNTKLGKVVTYAFWEPGVHNFTLVVKDDDGASSSIELSITIEKKPEPPPNPVNLDSDLGGLLVLLLLLVAIIVVVGVAIYMVKKRRGGAGERPRAPGRRSTDGSVVDRMAEVPPGPGQTGGDAHTHGTDFSGGGYHYPAYGEEVESYPHYSGDTETDTAYDYGYGYGSDEEGGSLYEDDW